MLRVLEICIRPDVHRIQLVVEMADPDRFLTSQVPQLPRHLFRLLPRMRRHTCHNDSGNTFCQECRETEIAHLFEHIIIELQLQAQQEPTDVLRGETEWNWHVDPRGRYRVSVDYQNELLAVGAIRLAERVLGHLDRRDVETIDIEAEIVRLRDVLLLGRALAGPDYTLLPAVPPAPLPTLVLPPPGTAVAARPRKRRAKAAVAVPTETK